MAQDRVLFGTFWSDERLAGLPPAGRLAYLFVCANVDRDGFGIVDVDFLASGKFPMVCSPEPTRIIHKVGC